jgi:hypothetical protein
LQPIVTRAAAVARVPNVLRARAIPGKILPWLSWLYSWWLQFLKFRSLRETRGDSMFHNRNSGLESTQVSRRQHGRLGKLHLPNIAVNEVAH